MKSVKTFLSLLIKSGKGWSDDKVTVWSAALSYYTVFSLAPLVLIIVSIAGLVLGRQAVQGELMGQLSGILGESGSSFVQKTVEHSANTSANIISAVISVVTLILGATGVFGQLKQTLNVIWGIETKKSNGILGIIRDRILSVSMILVIGFLLIISLVASSVISLIQTYFASYLPFPSSIIELINFLVSYALIAVLFSLIYKILPDVQTKWRYVLVGGALTSLLFTIGKTLLGIYIGSSSVTSTYGAAASLVVILIWVYYASQILFFGAEFTKYYALEHEKTIRPSKYGEVKEEETVTTAEKESRKLPKKIDRKAAIGVGVIYAAKLAEEIIENKKKSKKKKKVRN